MCNMVRCQASKVRGQGEDAWMLSTALYVGAVAEAQGADGGEVLLVGNCSPHTPTATTVSLFSTLLVEGPRPLVDWCSAAAAAAAAAATLACLIKPEALLISIRIRTHVVCRRMFTTLWPWSPCAIL